MSHPFTHPAAIGGTLVETFMVSNAGSNASGATLTITLAGHFVLGPVIGPGCVVGGTINCNLGTLNPGGAGSTAVVTVTLTPLLGRNISIQAMVSGTLPDNFPTNNSKGETIPVRPRPLAK